MPDRRAEILSERTACGSTRWTPHSSEFSLLGPPLVLLAAAVISVPIARFARLSAIVAYLVAGIVIGPYGLRLFSTPESVLPVAELGVVMLLFLIGLELELSRLLAMRRDIFGLGVAQLVLTAAAIAGLAIATGLFNWRARAGRRPRARDVRHLDRAAHPGRARTPAAALRPARLRDPAVPGHGDRAAARARAAARSVRRSDASN